MRVAEAVHVHAALGAHAGSLGLQQGDAPRDVEIGRAAGQEPRVSHRAEGPGQPRLVVEADAHQQRGPAQLGERARLDLHAVRVVERGGQAGHTHAVAADRFHERLEIGGGGDDGQGAAAPRGSGGQPEQRAGERAAHYDFLAKMLLGTMQCTPLRTSTTWLTRQSPTMEVSE